MKNIRLHILYILTKYIGYWHFSYILEKIKHILTKIYHLVICKINVSKYIFECISVYSTIVLLKCTLIIFCNIFFKQKETLRVTICLFIVLSNGSLLFFCSTLTDSFRHLNFFKLCKLFLSFNDCHLLFSISSSRWECLCVKDLSWIWRWTLKHPPSWSVVTCRESSTSCPGKNEP